MFLAVSVFSFGACVGSEPNDGEEVGEAQSKLCRDLQPGDPHYPNWIRCCDRGDGNSEWTKSDHVHSVWEGSCASYGIH